MSRKPRIHFPGACYHVMLRGNGGNDTFNDDADRSRFLLLLQECVERFSCRIHAFCLMSNHIHLAIQVGDIPLSRIMQILSFRYTRYFNRRTEVNGHLFQGRYKAILLDADNYLLELVRYIHLNPLRAGMIHSPGEYEWSSHQVYCGLESLPWLTRDWVLAQFSPQSKDAIKLYKNFISDGLTEAHRLEFHSGNLEGRLLGDDNFAESALRKAEQQFKRQISMDDIINHVCQQYEINSDDLALPGRQRNISEARIIAAWLILENNNLSLTTFSRRTNRDISSLSQGINRLHKRADHDNILSERMTQIRDSL